MYNKCTKFDENGWSHFWENENFNFFLIELPLNLRVDGKRKRETGNICKGTPDIEFEQDGSVGLGAIFANGQKIKNYLSSFRDFSGKSW